MYEINSTETMRNESGHFLTESRNICQQHQLLFAYSVCFAVHLIRPVACETVRCGQDADGSGKKF